jgi:hypothetical protein
LTQASDEHEARPSRLIGRDEELRAVRTAMHGAGCVVAGPAGVGK